MTEEPCEQSATREANGRQARTIGLVSAILAGLALMVPFVAWALLVGGEFTRPKDSGQFLAGIGEAFAVVVIGGGAMIIVTALALLSILLGFLSAWRSRIGDWGDVAWAMVGIGLSVFMLSCEAILLVFFFGPHAG